MFAEDTELLPPQLFANALREADRGGRLDPVFDLFEDLARKAASGKTHRFAPYVNGPLFDRERPRIRLSDDHLRDLHHAARDYDWRDVHPEIFGSIFEQALHPTERHELGAHFTREADIARVVFPTIVLPWRARARLDWVELKYANR